MKAPPLSLAAAITAAFALAACSKSSSTQQSAPQPQAAATAPPTPPASASAPALNPKIHACCDALRERARMLYPSQQSGNLNGAAFFCDQLAGESAPGDSTPEVDHMRRVVRSLGEPGVCNL